MSANTATARGSARSPSPSSTSLTWIRVSKTGAFIAHDGEEAGFDIRQVRIFLAEPDIVIATEDIAARLTAMRAVSFERKSIAVLVNGLRRKLACEQARLVTVRGLGFMLRGIFVSHSGPEVRGAKTLGRR